MKKIKTINLDTKNTQKMNRKRMYNHEISGVGKNTNNKRYKSIGQENSRDN